MESKPLVVDLDGTLIKSDLLFETANTFFLRHPFQFIRLLIWCYQGKSTLKEDLATKVSMNPALLPYNQKIIDWLKLQKAAGRSLILATASHRILAESVAHHLNLFNEVFATEDGLNLVGKNKRDLLVQRFGESGFDYLGNSSDDLPIWRSADKIYVLSSSQVLIKRIEDQGKSVEVFEEEKPSFIKSVSTALRPYQWIKNLLIGIPLLAAYQYNDVSKILLVFIAIFLFSIIASSVYLFNDLVDINEDRCHTRKCNRPFAAGNLSLLEGWVLWPLLVLVAFLLASLCMPLKFILVLSAYYLIALAYSLLLKQIPILDVLILAALYTLRIVAGTAAISVSLSFWLLAFSMFLFISLAFIKRFSEIQSMDKNKPSLQVYGRGYQYVDLQAVGNMGISSGYLAVLVLALYIQDAHTAQMYLSPQFIWLACPLMLYWISRVWFIANRGEMHDDPILFAIKDKLTWLLVVSMGFIFTLARLVS